ncbi:lipid II flippase MurJ [Asanoa sp. WMMD1127]|uniref:murein biosynthesis integral membrane protein MurJ n=1 Tax=Asanoa sp. WMMD1127 TaxID=3016107 RepID=UPI002417646B|nr:lipid II flippase MurJ [Asanoa sp. WMMD1127]MDG4824547.1 lipid II flippase MurJ [Asanoa sp. WMMD1127]
MSASTPPSTAAPPPVPGPRLARAAGLIGGLTVLSRIAGFGRTAVLGWFVGSTVLGSAYVTANTVPNIIFEIVAGGALAALVVPLLAGAVAAGDRRTEAGTVAALLTWTLTALIPLAVVVALLAGPIIDGLAGDLSTPARDAGVLMLRIFAPQLPLYGIGIVLTGVLQAHRRFAWPVIAPLLSSVVVAATYGLFAAVEGARADVPAVGVGGQLILAVGTTLGVVVLSLSLVIPARGLGLRLRPTWRFPGDAGRHAVKLAGAGVVTVGLQQVAVLVTLKLANLGPQGTVVVFTVAQAVYLLPWAILAVPVATAVYPALATAHSTGDHSGYRDRLAPAARGVLLLSCLGAAALAAVAEPVAGFFALSGLAAAVAGFAPGLLGYGLFAILTRALYARGLPRPAATATAIGWATVSVAAVVLSLALADRDRLLALTLANSIGMLVLGALLALAVHRRAGAAALAGFHRALLVGLTAGAAAAAAGWAVAEALGSGAAASKPASLWHGAVAGLVVLLVFAAVAYPLDRHDVRPAVAAVLRRLRGRRRRATG